MQGDDFDVSDYPALESVGLAERGSPLRVCIATEEIIGPVLNGGIASTYYHLAKGLAGHGHDVHVLFLKGRVVQDETPEHWIDHYAEFGVTLHYLEPDTRPTWGAGVTWLQRYAAAYAWLRDQEPFDVVHTSEWRGGLVYALMAKRMGLDFAETLFIVKTSSPHIWNRHYQMMPIDKRELLAASYAEQKCVELADMVVGGSAHLISFMERIGYRVPDVNVYVQPNIVDFGKVVVSDTRAGGPREPGQVVRSKDLVFFGRLEDRKGIALFCNALDVLQERGVVPDSVTFLGKWGARLVSQGGVTAEEYLAGKASGWGFPVSYLTEKHQDAALSFLCSRDMVAVMPSLIENSTMAVYEALEKRIPFVATAVGGTPELVAVEDHASCLVAPKAPALADRLQSVLEDGQVIAHPSFSNDDNLAVWYGFHAHVGALIAEHGRADAVGRLSRDGAPPPVPLDGLGYTVLLRREESVSDLVGGLVDAAPDHVVLGFTDPMMRDEVDAAVDRLSLAGLAATAVDCIGLAAGDALNTIVTAIECEAMVVAHGAGVTPKSGFVTAARRALEARPEALFTTFFTSDAGFVGMPIGGDVASQFLTSRAYGPELVALRRETLDRLGEFEPYDIRHGLIHEYVTRASEGGSELMVYAEELLHWSRAANEAAEFAVDANYAYFKAKRLIDEAGLAERKVLLATAAPSTGGGGVDEKMLRVGPEESFPTSHWLTPVGWQRDDVDSALGRRLVVGLDEHRDEIWFYARGAGDRQLAIRGTGAELELMEEANEADTDDHVTLHRLRLPASWESGASYPMIWGAYANGEKLRNLFLRVNKIGPSTFTLAGRNPVLSVGALRRLVALHADELVANEAVGKPDPWLATDPADLSRQAAAAGRALTTTAPSRDPDDDVPAEGPASGESRMVKDAVDAATRAAHQARERARQPVEEIKRSLERSRGLLPWLADSAPPRPPSTSEVRTSLRMPRHSGGWRSGEWLTGWAWDRRHQEAILHVRLMRDGTPVFATRADDVQLELDSRAPGLGRHGFRIPVLPSLMDAARLHLEVWEGGAVVHRSAMFVTADESGTARLMPAVHINRGMSNGRGFNGKAADRALHATRRSIELLRTPPPAPVRSRRSAVRAHLRPFDNPDGWRSGDWFVGWAWDPTQPDLMLHVAVLQHGRPVFLSRADKHRPVLVETAEGLERHGFRIPVIEAFTDPAHRGVQLVVWEDGGQLPRGHLACDNRGVLRQPPSYAPEHVAATTYSQRTAL